jgi:hypothetical protein
MKAVPTNHTLFRKSQSAALARVIVSEPDNRGVWARTGQPLRFGCAPAMLRSAMEEMFI